jgi:hypothetical protein
MNAYKTAALANLISEKINKAAKGAIPQESSEVVNFTVTFEDGESVKVQSIVKKGKDSSRPVPASFPMKEMFAAMFSKMNGVTVEAFIKQFMNGEIKATAERYDEFEAAWDALAATTMKKVTGSVKVSAKIEGEMYAVVEGEKDEKVA